MLSSLLQVLSRKVRAAFTRISDPHDTEHSLSYTKLDRKKLGSPKILQCPNCHILQAFCITTTTVTKCQCHRTWPLLSLTSCALTTPDQLPWLVFITRPHCQLLPGSPRKEQKHFRAIAFLWQQGRGSAALMSAFEGIFFVLFCFFFQEQILCFSLVQRGSPSFLPLYCISAGPADPVFCVEMGRTSRLTLQCFYPLRHLLS